MCKIKEGSIRPITEFEQLIKNEETKILHSGEIIGWKGIREEDEEEIAIDENHPSVQEYLKIEIEKGSMTQKSRVYGKRDRILAMEYCRKNRINPERLLITRPFEIKEGENGIITGNINIRGYKGIKKLPLPPEIVQITEAYNDFFIGKLYNGETISR